MKSVLAALVLAFVSTAALATQLQRPGHVQPAPGPDAHPDPALSDEDIRGQVRAYLGSIDTPISAARWKALGPRAEVALVEVVGSSALPTRRAKAIDGLSAVGTQKTSMLQGIANNEQEVFVVRYAALRALGNLLPEPQMIATLTPVMKGAKDLRVRAAAGAVMSRRAPKLACASVRAQVAREAKDDRAQFGRALDACLGQ